MDAFEAFRCGNYSLVLQRIETLKEKQPINDEQCLLWVRSNYELGRWRDISEDRQFAQLAAKSADAASLKIQTLYRLNEWANLVSFYIETWKNSADESFVIDGAPLAIGALVSLGKVEAAHTLAGDVRRFADNAGNPSPEISYLEGWTAELRGLLREAEIAYTDAILGEDKTEAVLVGRSRVRHALGHVDLAASDAAASLASCGGIEDANPEPLIAIIYVYDHAARIVKNLPQASILIAQAVRRAKYRYLAYPLSFEPLWGYAAAVGAAKKCGADSSIDVLAETRTVMDALQKLPSVDQSLILLGSWTSWLKLPH